MGTQMRACGLCATLPSRTMISDSYTGNSSSVELGHFAKETQAVPPALATAESLVPHLKKCGYSDAQIMRLFQVDQVTIPVVAFAGRPFDSWSACIAAVNVNGDSKA